MLTFRIFPHEDGHGYDVDLVGDPPAGLGEPPFPTTGAARRAVRAVLDATRTARIVVLSERPADAHEHGSL